MLRSKDGKRSFHVTDSATPREAAWLSIRDTVNRDRWSVEKWQVYREASDTKVGVAIDRDGMIIGGYACLFCDEEIHVEKLVVAHFCRRQWIGTALLDHLMRKVHRKGWESINVAVPDWNERAHAFLKARGLRATMRRSSPCDLYEFRWTYEDRNAHARTP